MPDPQTNLASEPAGARRGGRAAEETASASMAENRPFAAARNTAERAGEEHVSIARNLSQSAAGLTKDLGERARTATDEVAASWRGAMEPYLGLQMDMNRLFDDLWRQATGLGGAFSLRPARAFSFFGPAPFFGLPPVDVKETEESYLVCAELPGLAREDIDLQVRGDVLLISGHKAEERDDRASTFRVSERRFGRFDRSVPLPPDVRREQIDAAFRDGVLTVTLPKTAKASQPGSRIEIRS